MSPGWDGKTTAVTSLREPLRMTGSSVSRLVGGAERAGRVARTGDARDGRRRHLRLTPGCLCRLGRAFDALGPDRAALADALRGSSFGSIS